MAKEWKFVRGELLRDWLPFLDARVSICDNGEEVEDWDNYDKKNIHPEKMYEVSV